MAHENGWTFLDDRGRPATAPRTPERPVAYIQAGAALYDLGIRPVGVFGSAHDGAAADPVKAGALPLDGTAYLGPGPAVDAETVLAAGPDLVVAVAYGAGGPVYGLDPDTAKRIEERLPVVVLDVGQERSLDETRARFAELARSLGAPPPPAHSDAARAALTAAAAAATGTRVLALSPAGPDSVHLARPGAWPDLRALTDCGVTVAAPAPGPGINWSTTDWNRAALLEPDVVLLDVRANAAPPERLARTAGWREIEARARIVPWNPELPCSARAHDAFFRTVARALTARQG
ncbi:ABC transporter substrate-binding protein [Streptomyces zhihengii]|uniref:ABC transporter substrate-binding protein n=1 Tax=Streptomyces zhihengii TaxID=1818004 RepID=UPI003451CAE0